MSTRLRELPSFPVHEARLDGERIEIRIERELKNYNARNRNPHWSQKNKGRKQWQAAITNALVGSLGVQRAMQLLGPGCGIVGAHGGLVCRCDTKRCACPESYRRKLTILRLVPSKRNLIRDEFDNLPWATKEIRDAIKNVGLIRGDSDKWALMSVKQDVSPDGKYWTLITVEPVPCDHKFVDSTSCLKCGWEPAQTAPRGDGDASV